jgi:hypothetical protein
VVAKTEGWYAERRYTESRGARHTTFWYDRIVSEIGLNFFDQIFWNFKETTKKYFLDFLNL